MWPLKAIELVASGRVAQLFFSLLRNLFSLQAFTFRSSMVGLLSGLARSLSPSATCSTGGLEGIMCLAAGRSLQKAPQFHAVSLWPPWPSPNSFAQRGSGSQWRRTRGILCRIFFRRAACRRLIAILFDDFWHVFLNVKFE